MYASRLGFISPPQWMASLKPRMGGEPPWFQVLCCVAGFVMMDPLEIVGLFLGNVGNEVCVEIQTFHVILNVLGC